MSHKPVLLCCIFAPTIRFHEGRYYLITTLVGGAATSTCWPAVS
ncbi:MAG: hypothetical protein PVJ73_01920 [Acidobacteriota bacterium]